MIPKIDDITGIPTFITSDFDEPILYTPARTEFSQPCSSLKIITIKSDGSASGLLGVFGSVNSLINDRANRKKTEAETERIKAETEKIKVETQLLKQQLSAPDLKTHEDSIMNIQIECNNIIKESLAAGIVCELQSPENKVS